jgi:hypothetical protein
MRVVQIPLCAVIKPFIVSRRFAQPASKLVQRFMGLPHKVAPAQTALQAVQHPLHGGNGPIGCG